MKELSCFKKAKGIFAVKSFKSCHEGQEGAVKVKRVHPLEGSKSIISCFNSWHMKRLKWTKKSKQRRKSGGKKMNEMTGVEWCHQTVAVYLLSRHSGLRWPPATSLIHGRHHGRHRHTLMVRGNMLVLTHSQHRNTSTHLNSTSNTQAEPGRGTDSLHHIQLVLHCIRIRDGHEYSITPLGCRYSFNRSLLEYSHFFMNLCNRLQSRTEEKRCFPR